MVRVVTTVIPPVELDEGYMLLVVGKPEVEIGDEVSVIDLSGSKQVLNGLFVEDVDVGPLNELPQELLDQFWLLSLDAAHRCLMDAYKTGIAINTEVTIYALSPYPLIMDFPFDEFTNDDVLTEKEQEDQGLLFDDPDAWKGDVDDEDSDNKGWLR